MSSFFSTYVFPSRPTLNYWEKSVSLSLAQRDQISDWKQQVLDGASTVFEGSRKGKEPDIKELHAKIGELTLENDFLERALSKAGRLSAKR